MDNEGISITIFIFLHILRFTIKNTRSEMEEAVSVWLSIY
ncbi:hypothetical protein Bsph_4028 [Lysinibacillus sphaericus C3-41]|uniref:Uncharacterized protein n=1 Tax=Lysinibacillus sphaericus (strain C3-41) TaxID=444177 RepID=B1HW57_LYSSC|nr:hypothetical protein Bsph_4028 [Lysinibacillus sphaericus C3-41]